MKTCVIIPTDRKAFLATRREADQLAKSGYEFEEFQNEDFARRAMNEYNSELDSTLPPSILALL